MPQIRENTYAGGVVDKEIADKTVERLTTKHGEQNHVRIRRGVDQVAALWRAEDGTSEQFTQFCLDQFINDQMMLKQTLSRFEANLESIAGHNLEIRRDLSSAMQLDVGPMLAVDYLFAEYDPYAHISDDFFRTKIAFVALLNFPVYSLGEKLQLGNKWDRDDWAKARLADRFTVRVPAEITQNLTKAYVQAEDYISNYNIYMNQLLDEKDNRPFPKGLKLISHWNLRDELKAQYAQPDGLAKQQMIQCVMERIVLQDIPEAIINSEQMDWFPFSNVLPKNGQGIPMKKESNRRYFHWLNIFHAEHNADAFYPHLPSKIARSFERDREIPEKQVERLLIQVLTDSVGKDVAKLISTRVKRNLQPFDIWYNGFKPRSSYDESMLDKIVLDKYPNTEAFQLDLSNILKSLGFSRENASFLANKITIDPSRGIGHAQGAGRRADNAHLRTRIPKEGMRYKGYNIAIHELGHCVEQVFSLNQIDHTLLAGVPNTAFTEAFAFTFQTRDLELLGLQTEDPQTEQLRALDTYWSTCEIAAVGLVDMRVWRWLYQHPDATSLDLKAAVIQIAKEVWNQYFAPLIGEKDSPILAIYSHMIDAGLYLPDYSLGLIIMFQIENYLKDKNLGIEMQRMCTIGAVTPDAWMRTAVGDQISAASLIHAARQAILKIK